MNTSLTQNQSVSQARTAYFDHVILPLWLDIDPKSIDIAKISAYLPCMAFFAGDRIEELSKLQTWAYQLAPIFPTYYFDELIKDCKFELSKVAGPYVSTDPLKPITLNSDRILEDLEDFLISLDCKLSPPEARKALEHIVDSCKDEVEFTNIVEGKMRGLVYGFDDGEWKNAIAEFKRRIKRRVDIETYRPDKSQDNQDKDKKWSELVNDLKLIQQETNPAKRQFLMAELAQDKRIKGPTLQSILLSLDEATVTPEKDSFSLDDLLNEDCEGEDYLVPGYVPKGDLIILSAKPKVGKTLLVTDLSYAALTGKPFLGESVAQGRVLYVTSDEGRRSLKRRLMAAGFAQIPPELRKNFDSLTSFDITHQSRLLSKCQEFKPDLIIIDSLTSVSRNSQVSEKDPEFARPLYQLRDLVSSVNAACVLIHHDNKSETAKGIDKMSGSLRIAAAAWGVWQLATDAQDNTLRKLTITPRETESTAHYLSINPKAQWSENGIYSYKGEVGDESGEKRTELQKVIELLKNGDRLEALEINQVVHSKNIYAVLSRGEERNQILCDRSKTTGKPVYFVPNRTDNSENGIIPANSDNPLPLPTGQDFFDTNNKSLTEQGIEVTNTFANIPLTLSLTPLLTPPTNTPVSEGGGEAQPDVIPDNVLTFQTVETAPINEVEKPQIAKFENGNHGSQNSEPSKNEASFVFELGDRVISIEAPNLSLEIVSIDPDGEWCRCKHEFGIERYALSELIPDEF
jgi:archaellum biogenesis ATPase FlaH